MSLAHFDEILEILLGMTEEEEAIMEERPLNVRGDPRKDRIENYRWWEEAAKEIEAEKNKEKEGVYV